MNRPGRPRHAIERSFTRAGLLAGPLIIVLAVLLLYQVFWRHGDDPLIVYCAHDAIFSQQVLEQFEAETGIAVDVRFDNEATKSLGLTRQIIAERDNPRCDVFWNNQLLGTADLAERGLLEAYKGPGYERIAAGYKDPLGRYCGFAARLRVYIINTNLLDATPAAVDAVLGGDLSRTAVAKPIYGTTLSHYAVLQHHMGDENLKVWRAAWLGRGVLEGGSNSTVKQLVAEGRCVLGWTDTDDFYLAKDLGKPVDMLPIRVGGRTICMPNTVAIIKGTPRLQKAQALVEFLLSEQVELMLAGSKARQIPLGQVDETKLSAEVRQMRTWAADSHELPGMVEARRQVLAWLTEQLSP